MDLLQHGPKYRYVVSKMTLLKGSSCGGGGSSSGELYGGRGRHLVVHGYFLWWSEAVWWWRETSSSGGGVIWWWRGYLPWWRMGRLVIYRYTLMPIQHIFHRLHYGLQILQLAFILASCFNFVLKLPLDKGTMVITNCRFLYTYFVFFCIFLRFYVCFSVVGQIWNKKKKRVKIE